ncbi:MAG: hypothetical protein ISQ34_02540 [Rickettsiales bacterium]|nr:hypothetical protein [Rickettsiales bacterium]
MKKIITCVFLLSFATHAFAFNLGGLVDNIGKESADAVNKNINGQVDKVVKKFEDKIDGYKKEIDAEVDKYKKQIKEAEAMINKIKEIRANADRYIRNVKIVIGVLGSGIFALIFVMWRIWRNMVNMRKIITNVTNYDDIEKRLKAVEKALAAK